VSNLELKGLRLLRNLETSLSDSSRKDINITHLALEFLRPGKYQPRKHIDGIVLPAYAVY